MLIEEKISNEMLLHLRDKLLAKWYPKIIDKDYGGFYSNLTCDFQLSEEQDKMVVTQARHIWTLCKSSYFFNDSTFKEFANHGYEFLTNKLWDKNNGGFYQIKDRNGKFTNNHSWLKEKRVYGNAFALYGISALYKLTENPEVQDFAIKIFSWIEQFSYDPINKGYFQFFTEDNKVFNKESDHKSSAEDAIEVGYKDQNSAIHLLEAFTEAFSIFNTPLLRTRLEELLILIRDKIVTEDGYLQLFFTDNWQPISFKNSTKKIREANYRLDHVSFGHDYETAFLMLEASYTLELKNDLQTLITAKKMVDHALVNGWDNEYGGFYEEGYYFAGEDKCTIIKNSKNWWAQAEALNIFLIMSKIFPHEEKYFKTFIKLWEYVKEYVIDKEYGGWFWGGIDKQPEKLKAPKGEIWKATYHNGRALMNCIAILSSENNTIYNEYPGIKEKSKEINDFLTHWKDVAKQL